MGQWPKQTLKPLPIRKRSLTVKVDFNFRSDMEINIMLCLEQSEHSIHRSWPPVRIINPMMSLPKHPLGGQKEQVE